MTETAAKKRQARTTSDGMSPADRAMAWERDLKRAGGHRLPVNLGASAWRELQAMAGKRERGPLIERLVLQEAARRRRERSSG